MSDNSIDPSGNTEAFRAFTRTAPEPAAPSKLPLILGGLVAAAAVLIALALWLAP